MTVARKKKPGCPQAALRDGKMQCLSPGTCAELGLCQAARLRENPPRVKYLPGQSPAERFERTRMRDAA